MRCIGLLACSDTDRSVQLPTSEATKVRLDKLSQSQLYQKVGSSEKHHTRTDRWAKYSQHLQGLILHAHPGTPYEVAYCEIR